MIGFRQVADRITVAVSLLLMGAGAAAPAWGAGKSRCAECAEWNTPHKPFRIYGNTYYVGTAGLGAVLITSSYGHVLIDGGLPESAPLIAQNIESLGFKVSDIKAILNSHPHFDHAGGIAELQRASGAQVYALRAAEPALRSGKVQKDDPQAAARMPAFPAVPQLWVVQDDQLLGVGAIRLRVLATPGHTPGGTSWSWDACDGSNCLRTVYADSLMPVAAGKFRFRDHPEVLQDFEHSFQRLEAAQCELVLTPHVDAARLAALEQAGADAGKLKDEAACRKHVQQARAALQQRLATEG